MKWWFSDFDGTMCLTGDNKISEMDFNFIKNWTKENKLVVATGRSKKEIINILKDNKIIFDYVITNNGATIYKSNGKLFLNQLIDLNIRKEIVEKLDELVGKCGIAITIGENRYILSGIEDPQLETTNKYIISNWKNIKNIYQEYKKEILTNLQLINISFYSIEGQTQKLINLFSKIPNLKIIETVPNFVVELMNFNASKLNAIKFIQNIHDFNDNKVYVSGDGLNDLDMIEYFKNSFAIESGHQLLKQKANYIIKKISDIKKFL